MADRDACGDCVGDILIESTKQADIFSSSTEALELRVYDTESHNLCIVFIIVIIATWTQNSNCSFLALKCVC